MEKIILYSLPVLYVVILFISKKLNIPIKVINPTVKTPTDVVETLPIEIKPIEIKEDTIPIPTIKIIKVKEEPVEITTPKVDTIKTIKPQLLIKRTDFTDTSTIGELYLDGKFVCYTLEDKDRKLENGGKKIYGETAIPRGTYEVEITYSPKFERFLPLLINVPQFENIRLHNGRDIVTEKDTHGCIIPCFKTIEGYQKSKEANRMVTEIIAEKLKKEKVYIKII